MRIWLIVSVVCGWMVPVTFADYQKTPGTRVDLGELTSELKAAVPNLEGCDDTNGLMTCRRLTGDFTDAEKAAMDAALTAHDPDVRIKRKAKRQQDRASGDAKLKALGLTEEEIKAMRER